MDFVDGLQVSLLDVGLSTEQIERVQAIIEEAGSVMLVWTFNKLSDEENMSPEQINAILLNLFGYMLGGDHPEALEEMKKELGG